MVAKSGPAEVNGNVTVVSIVQDAPDIHTTRNRILSGERNDTDDQTEGVEDEEPLQIIEEDLGEYLRNHGCVIQKTLIDFSSDLSRSFSSSSDMSVVDRTYSSPDSANFEYETTEQQAKISILSPSPDYSEAEHTEVTVNKGAIVDQNVGVSGEVYMVSPYAFPADANSEPKLQSYENKVTPTVVYIGSIKDDEIEKLLKSKRVIQTIEETEDGPSSITLSFYESTVQSDDANGNGVDDLDTQIDSKEKIDERESIGKVNATFMDQKPLVAPSLLLQWRVRPPEEPEVEENEDLVTPSSSMFSSAYTVTELSSDNSYDRSPPSEYSNSTFSSRRASEDDEGSAMRQNEAMIRFHEYLALFRQLSMFNGADPVSLNGLSTDEEDGSSTDDEVINRGSTRGSGRSIVFSYIPCRDQREKEQEELWVANEATYSFSHELSRSDNESEPEDKHEIVPNFLESLPGISIIVNQIDDTTNSSKIYVSSSCQTSQNKSNIKMIAAATQTTYSCFQSSNSNKNNNLHHASQHTSASSVPKRRSELVFSRQETMTPRVSRNLARESGSSDGRAASVVPETASGVGEGESEAPSMATTVLCSAAASDRRHFSARQRIVETLNGDENNIVVCQEDKSNKKDVTKIIETSQSNSVMSLTTNQPTKRFSFLLRSNSDADQKCLKQNSNPSVSASDMAILARLAELKLNAENDNKSTKIQISASNNHKKDCQSDVTKPNSTNHGCTTKPPLCKRCLEPVYPQEKLQPSRDIILHTSCFKCHQCGLRLNLNTFYRSPLSSSDFRVFCKSHVPSLDPGKRIIQDCNGSKNNNLPAVSPKNSHTTSIGTEVAGSKMLPTDCRRSLTTISSPNTSTVSLHNRHSLPALLSTSEERVVIKCDTQGLRYF